MRQTAGVLSGDLPFMEEGEKAKGHSQVQGVALLIDSLENDCR